MYIYTLVVTDVPSDVTDVPVVTYVDYVLGAITMLAFMSTFGVRTVIGSRIGVHTIFGSNNLARCSHLLPDGNFGFCVGICTEFSCGAKVGDVL